jgi:uncharacterized membrane protein
VSPRLWELLDLAARWVHVIAGIMWIGNSLLFNWLDRTLSPPAHGGEGKLGESWLLHSGGFYFVEKTQLVGQGLPTTLHWFKWQAYTTWLSGAALLIVVYYVGGRAVMADASVATLSHGAAVAVGLGAIVGGLALYEVVQRALAPRAPRIATVVLLAAFIAIVYALTHLLNGRAAFLHVGAMLATIMAGNVANTIVPSQRELVKTVTRSGRADPGISARAKRVSITNNYVTFPVIALMVSSHFPSLSVHRFSWLLLLVIVACGAAVRYIMNVRYTFAAWKPALAVTVASSFALLYALLSIGPAAPGRTSSTSMIAVSNVTFADARHVIDRRCAACHSLSPSDSTFGAAPAGVAFDLPAQIQSYAARIRERAVVTKTMPPANKTHITEQERLILGAWIDAGAKEP